jgi:asparagine synthetase A
MSSESLHTPRADNDNSAVKAEKARIDVYNALAKFKDTVEARGRENEIRSTLVSHIEGISTDLFEKRIAPMEAAARAEELARNYGFVFTITGHPEK